MTTWADVAKGDRVTMSGRPFDVVKVKGSGKKRTVTVKGGGGVFMSEVKAKAAVELEPLHKRDTNLGAETQNRWAKPTEAHGPDEQRRIALPPGDAEQTKRPAKATGGPWDAPKGRAEKVLEDILDAHLVGEADDENAGYYVPPVDDSTVAAHGLLFHGQVMDLEQHVAAHSAGGAFKTNHWHTKERP